MKSKSAAEIYRSIRKPIPPPTRIVRPLRGRGYRRPRNQKDIYGEKHRPDEL